MTLLIDVNLPQWMSDQELRDGLRPLLPKVEIRCRTDPGDPIEIVMLATARLAPGLVRNLPSLQLIQKLGAGVDTILDDPDLAPHVRVTRLRTESLAQEVAEYCLAYVLREQRNMSAHESNQKLQVWQQIAPRRASETVVGILGLGQIGSQAALAFRPLGFHLIGWSRSPRAFDGIDCRHGNGALEGVLDACDYVIAALPSTPATRGIFDARRFAAMKSGSIFINVGRGDLVVERGLLDALDSGHLSGAVLDVHLREPLPSDHPFWRHPKITMTPHVSGWHLNGGLEIVSENYRRLLLCQPLLLEVDRDAGY